MTQKEKENRIHSFALGFLGKQQIVPNLYADQIIRGYKEGYRQAEKDLELTWEDMKEICFLFKTVRNEWYGHEFSDYGICREVLKRFKAQKGEQQ